jgi:short subunit dehydrogenase-like uncharacterized protein
MSFGAGPRAMLTATAVSLGTAAVMATASVGPLRKLLAKTVLPAPGQGPSKEQRDSGFFVFRFVGLGTTGNGAPPAKVFGTVRGVGDPGYSETAKMLTESAVCLAVDGAIGSRGGVLTPAACMGMRLIERLRGVGMTFETVVAN